MNCPCLSDGRCCTCKMPTHHDGEPHDGGLHRFCRQCSPSIRAAKLAKAVIDEAANFYNDIRES